MTDPREFLARIRDDVVARARSAAARAGADLPALVQTLSELRSELAGATALEAVLGHRIVAAVRGRVAGDTLHVGRLIVAPDRQGSGIGTDLLAALEAAAPTAVRRATVFTGDRSIRNLGLYGRLGYVEERREATGTGIVLVHLTKSLGDRSR